MSIIKFTATLNTEDQIAEVSTLELGGVQLMIAEIDEQGELYNPRLYLTKDEALTLASMLQDIAAKAK